MSDADLPDGWETIRLQSIATKVGSGATPRGGAESYHSYGVPLIRSMNVHFQGFKNDGLAFIDDQQAAQLKEVSVRTGDVLLNITGASIGRVTEAPQSMDGARVNQHVCIIRPVSSYDATFLRLYLSSPRMQQFINTEQYGVTRQALTKSQILSFELPLPPPAEQKRIVEKVESLLARVSASRERLGKVPAILKRFRQAVLAAACSGRLTADWRDKHNIFVLSTTSIGNLPIEIQTGPFGSTLHRSDYAPGGVPLVNPMHISSGQIAPDNDFCVQKKKAAQLTRYCLRKGDVVLARRGEMGRAAVVTAREDGFICGTGSLFLRPDAERIDSNFISLFLRSPDTVNQLLADSVGTTMANLNQGIVAALEIPNFEMDEQQEIVRRVEKLFKLANAIEKRLALGAARAEKLTQAILAKAFRGELVPTEAELARQEGRSYESAAELLKRLNAQKFVNQKESGECMRASQRQFPKAQIERGKVVAFGTLLLHTIGTKVTREVFDRCLLLMLNDDILQFFAGKRKRVKGSPKFAQSLDSTLASMKASGVIAVETSATRQTITIGPKARPLSDFDPAMQATARLAVSVFERLKDKDQLAMLERVLNESTIPVPVAPGTHSVSQAY